MPKKVGSLFMDFVKNWMARQPHKMKLPDAVFHAGKIWENMSEAERKQFKETGKWENEEAPKKNGHQGGIPGAQPHNGKDEKRLVRFVVKDSVRNDKITSQRYIFILTNCPKKGVTPTEVALVAYSYKEGIASMHHAMINADTAAGRNKSGGEMANTIKTRFDIYTELLNFVHDADNEKCDFVYTKREFIEMVQDGIDSLRGDKPDTGLLRVLPIEYLLFQIKEALSLENHLNQPIYFEVEKYFNEGKRDGQEAQNACAYHQLDGNVKSCVLPTVKLWGTIATEWLKGATDQCDSDSMNYLALTE